MKDDGGEILEIKGGVTAPAGFLAGSIYCGIKQANLDKADIALICSETPAVAAGTFTTNKVKAAPVVTVTRTVAPRPSAAVASPAPAPATPGLTSAEAVVDQYYQDITNSDFGAGRSPNSASTTTPRVPSEPMNRSR